MNFAIEAMTEKALTLMRSGNYVLAVPFSGEDAPSPMLIDAGPTLRRQATAVEAISITSPAVACRIVADPYVRRLTEHRENCKLGWTELHLDGSRHDLYYVAQ